MVCVNCHGRSMGDHKGMAEASQFDQMMQRMAEGTYTNTGLESMPVWNESCPCIYTCTQTYNFVYTHVHCTCTCIRCNNVQYASICVHAHACVHTCTCTCTCACNNVYIHVHVLYMHVHVHVIMCTYMYMHVHACTCACNKVYIHVHACTCMIMCEMSLPLCSVPLLQGVASLESSSQMSYRRPCTAWLNLPLLPPPLLPPHTSPHSLPPPPPPPYPHSFPVGLCRLATAVVVAVTQLTLQEGWCI